MLELLMLNVVNVYWLTPPHPTQVLVLTFACLNFGANFEYGTCVILNYDYVNCEG